MAMVPSPNHEQPQRCTFFQFIDPPTEEASTAALKSSAQRTSVDQNTPQHSNSVGPSAANGYNYSPARTRVRRRDPDIEDVPKAIGLYGWAKVRMLHR